MNFQDRVGHRAGNAKIFEGWPDRAHHDLRLTHVGIGGIGVRLRKVDNLGDRSRGGGGPKHSGLNIPERSIM